MSATRSTSFNDNSRTQAGLGQRSGLARRSTSLLVNASTTGRKPNRVDASVSTSGLKDFVRKGTLPPYFAAIVYRRLPTTSMVSHINGDLEKVFTESPSELFPVDIGHKTNAMIHTTDALSQSIHTNAIQGRSNTERPTSEGDTNPRTAKSTSATAMTSISAEEHVPLSRTSRHSRSMSTPRPILRGPGRSLPDVSTTHITIHDRRTIREEEPSGEASNDGAVSPPLDSHREVRHASILREEIPPTVTPINEDDVSADADADADASDDSDTFEDAIDEVAEDELEESEVLTELTENVNSIDLNGTLAPFIIAHDRDAVIRMNKWNIAWGIQYEIARGVSQKVWTWDDVTDERLEMLQGSNSDKGQLVTDIFRNDRGTGEAFLQAERIFDELDREQKARLENAGRGLGLRGCWEGVDHWYGGRIQQIARLRKVPGSEAFSVTLDKLQHGRSNRVTRFVGSRSILQIRIEEKLVKSQGNRIIKFLSKRQVLCGRIFYPFYAKENKVYFVECNENLDRRPQMSEGDQFRLSWKEFVSWHNPLDLNRHQPISKWATRWAIALSTTKPVLEFKPEDVYFIDDIYASEEQHGTEEIMTDGCGFMNSSAFVTILTIMGRTSTPLDVVQGRFAGSKGLWIRHPDSIHDDRSAPPKIWIRKSQNKIQLPPLNEIDRSHLIFDLVRLPRLTHPSNINKQTITNLCSNGVPASAIENLLEEGLNAEIRPLKDWKEPNACVHLAKAVENIGRVVGGRRGRQASLEARAFAYIKDESDENEEVRDGALQGGLVDRYVDSGCPTDLYEVTRDLLMAGFSPLSLPFLRTKFKKIIEIVTKRYVDQYHISVPNSVEAFIAPDPTGVLEEGEIYFRSSEPFGDQLRTDPNSVTGPVLVMRNPTMVASDVQRVTAVKRIELLPYTNVILFSTKGSRSLASYLGGGDYDGDTVTIVFEGSIVDTFTNATTVREPRDLRDNFQPEIEKVSAFYDRVRGLDDASHAYELSKNLLSGLSDSKVGLYSRFHENVVYSHGYLHSDAVRLAYMFTTCLDSTKSGLKIKEEVFREDHKQYCNPQPRYVLSKNVSDNSQIGTRREFTRYRRQSLGPFILDTLQTKGYNLQTEVLREHNEYCNENMDDSHDASLLALYKNALDAVNNPDFQSASNILSGELQALRMHVQDLVSRYKDALYAYDGMQRGLRSHDGTSRRALVQGFVTEFWSFLPRFKLLKVLSQGMARECMASYAYWYSVHCERWLRDSVYVKEFPFVVASRELRAIKSGASSSGSFAVTQTAADALTINGSLLKSSVSA